MSVWLGAGVSFGELTEVLQENGLGLLNVLSYPHINVVGAVVTGSHGGGYDKQSMANYVTAMQIVDAKGNLRDLEKGKDKDFEQWIHAFGTLGVITKIKMDTVESFSVTKCIYENLYWEKALKEPALLNDIMHLGDYLSFFTDFKEPRWSSVWVGNTNQDTSVQGDFDKVCEKEVHGATLTKATHPVLGGETTHVTESGIGLWNEKIYHSKPNVPNEASPQIHSEFFIHDADLALALSELWKHRDQFNSVLMISELRQIDGDDLPRSPHNIDYHARGGRKLPSTVYAIHFTWYNDRSGVQKATVNLREILRQFNAIPHPGKLFHLEDPSLYSEFFLKDMHALKKKIEKEKSHIFLNCWAYRYIIREPCPFKSQFEEDYGHRKTELVSEEL